MKIKIFLFVAIFFCFITVGGAYTEHNPQPTAAAVVPNYQDPNLDPHPTKPNDDSGNNDPWLGGNGNVRPGNNGNVRPGNNGTVQPEHTTSPDEVWYKENICGINEKGGYAPPKQTDTDIQGSSVTTFQDSLKTTIDNLLTGLNIAGDDTEPRYIKAMFLYPLVAIQLNRIIFSKPQTSLVMFSGADIVLNSIEIDGGVFALGNLYLYNGASIVSITENITDVVRMMQPYAKEKSSSLLNLQELPTKSRFINTGIGSTLVQKRKENNKYKITEINIDSLNDLDKYEIETIELK